MREERTVMLEEGLTDAVDQATKQEYIDGREEERSRSDVINGAIGIMFDEPIDDELMAFLRDYGADPERVIERLARHAECADCSHVWRLSKPIDEYEDGPRCSECGSREVAEIA